MPETMLAIRKSRSEKGLWVEEVPRPRIDSDEVLVQVEAASICGTDLHIWKWDEWSQRRIKPPLTLGHEFAGTIVQVGEKVQQAKVGDYVSAESHVTCGMCYQCRTGQAHMCPNTKILGVDRNGAFAQFVAVPEKVIWQNNREKIPPEIATLQEPFGNAVFATMNQDVAGQTVAVMGCGPIGLFTIGIAKAAGAAAVYACDLNEFRLNLARQMGATQVFNVGARAGGISPDPVQMLVDANHGSGIDIILEMSGAPSAINISFKAVRNGGRVILFGIPSKPVEIDVAENMIFKNLTVLALNGRRIFDTWYKTRWLLEQGVVDLRPLVTKTITLEEIGEAMELLNRGEACKIVLLPNPTESRPVAERVARRAQDPNIKGAVVHR
jgi:threonine 3-dehydrogenase